MKTHLKYDASGDHVTGIITNVYLAKVDIRDMSVLKTCAIQFTKFGPRFGNWLVDLIDWELDRHGTAIEAEPLVIPFDWEPDDYSQACCVLVFIMRVMGPRPWLMQLAYAVATVISIRAKDSDSVIKLD